jgi:hypothetical protein
MDASFYSVSMEKAVRCVEYLNRVIDEKRSKREKSDTDYLRLCYDVARMKGAMPQALSATDALHMASAALLLNRLEDAKCYFSAMVATSDDVPSQQAYGLFAVSQTIRLQMKNGEVDRSVGQEEFIACANTLTQMLRDRKEDTEEWRYVAALYEIHTRPCFTGEKVTMQ